MAENFFDRAELVGFAVNNKIALVAQALDVLAEDARAQGMEGADGGGAGFAPPPAGAWRRGMSLKTRSCISRAALLVNVTARMWPGATPFSIRRATREVMTRVLPVPAPARIKTAPSVVSTACRCCGLSEAREDMEELRMADCGLRISKTRWGETVRQARRSLRRAVTCAGNRRSPVKFGALDAAISWA